MNVLSVGMPFEAGDSSVHTFTNGRGHEIRTLAVDQPADFDFEAGEYASDVIERIAKTWKPDVLVCWRPELYPPPLAVEYCPIKTVAIASDWIDPFPIFAGNLSRFDIVLTDKLGAQTLHLPGVTPQFLTPLDAKAVSTKQEGPDSEDKDIDILFAGNRHSSTNRGQGQCLEKVAGLSDQYKVVILDGDHNGESSDLLSRTRIAFHHSARCEMDHECFQALALGVLLFLEEENIETTEYLLDREEIVLYRPDNVVDLLNSYLQDPKLLQSVAHNGQSKFSELAIESRMNKMFDWMMNQSQRERVFRKLSNPRRRFADLMLYSTCKVASQRAWAKAELPGYVAHYPDRPEFLAAHALLAFGQHAGDYGQDDTGYARRARRFLRRACELAPDSAPLWLNLAYVYRHCSEKDNEIAALESALSVNQCQCAGLLLGSIDDPYCAAWRRALAMGSHGVEILWGAAATRLARLFIDERRLREARDLARRATNWCPAIPDTHHVLAIAEKELGNLERAAKVLSDALSLTAFDSEYRIELIRLWLELGREADAHELAEESARIFQACPGNENLVQRLHDLAAMAG